MLWFLQMLNSMAANIRGFTEFVSSVDWPWWSNILQLRSIGRYFHGQIIKSYILCTNLQSIRAGLHVLQMICTVSFCFGHLLFIDIDQSIAYSRTLKICCKGVVLSLSVRIHWLPVYALTPLKCAYTGWECTHFFAMIKYLRNCAGIWKYKFNGISAKQANPVGGCSSPGEHQGWKRQIFQWCTHDSYLTYGFSNRLPWMQQDFMRK
jgi:hypothetical protein